MGLMIGESDARAGQGRSRMQRANVQVKPRFPRCRRSHQTLRMVWFNGGMPNAGSRLTGGFNGGSRVIRAPGRLVHFAVIGTICTVAFSIAYVLLRRVTGPIEANIVALSLTMTVNFLANRRFTFRAADGPLGSQIVGYLVVYVLGLGVSSTVLYVALAVASSPLALVETIIALGSGFTATVVRFVLLSAWVFRRPAAVSAESMPGSDAA